MRRRDEAVRELRRLGHRVVRPAGERRRSARRAHRARARDRRARRRRAHQPRGRRAARAQHPHDRGAPAQHLREARGPLPHGACPRPAGWSELVMVRGNVGKPAGWHPARSVGSAHGASPRRIRPLSHRARRRLHAGEPVVRPLLRRLPARTRVLRSGRHRPARRPRRLPPARSGPARGIPAAVPPRHRARGRREPGRRRPQLGRRPRRVQRRRLRRLDRCQGAAGDGLLHAPRHGLLLRPRRRVHAVRRLPLLGPVVDGPEPPVPDERHDRPGWAQRRPRVRRQRAAARVHLDDVPRAAGAGRRVVAGLPDARQLQRQRARLVRAVPVGAGGVAPGPQGHGLDRHRPVAGGRPQRHACRTSRGSSRRPRSRSIRATARRRAASG